MEVSVISLQERAKVEAKGYLEQLLAEGARKLLQAAIENEFTGQHPVLHGFMDIFRHVSAHCGSHSRSVSNAASHGPVACGVAGVMVGVSVFIIDLTFRGVDRQRAYGCWLSCCRHVARASPSAASCASRPTRRGCASGRPQDVMAARCADRGRYRPFAAAPTGSLVSG